MSDKQIMLKTDEVVICLENVVYQSETSLKDGQGDFDRKLDVIFTCTRSYRY